MDRTVRDDIFPGLTVKIKTPDNEIAVGIVEEVKTIVAVDFDGIYVVLKTGEEGNIIEIILTKTEQLSLNLISKLKKDLKFDEGQILEFKESFGYPTKAPSSVKITNPDKSIQLIVGKTVSAFANAFGGTLYVGVHDKTHELMGLERDYSLLKDENQNADGLEITIKNTLKGYFNNDNRIFESVYVTTLKYESKDVCIINVKPSTMPFILEDESKYIFYVRHGNSSEPYTIHKFLEYWPKHLQNIAALQSTGKDFLDFLNPF